MRSGALVGRDHELARAGAALDDVMAGEARLLFFVGEPGIGKTRIMQAVEQSARGRGFRLGWGRCWEAGGAPAFWPWSQAFEALEIAHPFAASEGAALGDVRFEQFDRARRALVDAAAEAPVAVLLDDLHVADQPSLSLLQALARGIAHRRVLLLGTYRDAEARVGETGALLTKIAREGEIVALERLREEDVSEWIDQEAPGVDASIGRRVHALSEGNPLFIHEILRVGNGSRLDARTLPDSLRAVLDEHLALVSAETGAILAKAAVLGREAANEDVAALADAPADEIDARLREAAAAGLLEPSAEGARHAFAHVLLRERLYLGLAPSARAALHARAGKRLLARDDVDGAAHHLLEAARAGEGVESAARVAGAAVERALARFAFEDAVERASRALEVLGPSQETALACELSILRAEGSIRLGKIEHGKQECVRAAALARRLGLAPLEARAALAYGTELASSLMDPTMVRLLRDALSTLEEDSACDPGLRARVMIRLAAALVPPTDSMAAVESIRLGRDALAAAEALGDAEASVYVHFYACASLLYHIAREEALALVEKTVSLATALERPLVLLQVGPWWVACLRELGRLREAARALEAFVDLARRIPLPQHGWRVPLVRATVAILDGDLEAATRLGREARASAEASGSTVGMSGWAQHRIALAVASGEAPSIEPDAESVLAAFALNPIFAPYSAWVLAAVGRADEARALIANYSFGTAITGGRYPTAFMGAEVACLLGDVELARRVYEAFEVEVPLLTMFWGGPVGTACLGPASRMRGNLLALLGRTDEARCHWTDALRTTERLGAVPHQALVRRSLDALGTAPSKPPPALAVPDARIELIEEADGWTLRSFTGISLRLKDGKGVRYLQRLLEHEGREIHAMELAEMDEPDGDAGAILDPKAKEAYKRRLADLREELDEATSFADSGRAARVRDEIDALTNQLAAAVGLGGRDRKAGSLSERARVNVQRRVRSVIEQITKADAALGRYLALAVKTGTFCSFSRL